MGSKEQRHDEDFMPPHHCTECGNNIFKEGHADGCPEEDIDES